MRKFVSRFMFTLFEKNDVGKNMRSERRPFQRYKCTLHSHQDVRLLLLLYNNNISIRVAWPGLAWSIAEYAYKHNSDFIAFAFLFFLLFFPSILSRKKNYFRKQKPYILLYTLFYSHSFSPFLNDCVRALIGYKPK